MTAIAFARATAVAVAAVGWKIIAGARVLVSSFVQSIAEARIHQARLEAELYRNRYKLRTRNDDDLPIVR